MEWYRNGPLGLEQGFNLRSRPRSAAGWLTLSERVSGELVARRVGRGLLFARSLRSQALLRYDALSASDATGRSLPTRLELRGTTVLLRVDDAGARYPLTIDPMIQQGPKLTVEHGSSFGRSVALSSDGNTALIGGADDNESVGAVWVFTRSGSSWTQQGQSSPPATRPRPGSSRTVAASSAKAWRCQATATPP